MRFVVSLLFAAVGSACAHGTIPGTQIRATSENRAVYDVVMAITQAMRDRNVQGVLQHVSPSYFEDQGTAARDDDFGFAELQETVLPASFAAAKEIFLDIEVQNIAVDGDTAIADVRYRSRTRLEVPAGTIWDSHREFNRLEFTARDGRWLVTAGL